MTTPQIIRVTDLSKFWFSFVNLYTWPVISMSLWVLLSSSVKWATQRGQDLLWEMKFPKLISLEIKRNQEWYLDFWFEKVGGVDAI